MSRMHVMPHARLVAIDVDVDAREFDLRDLAFPPLDGSARILPESTDDPFGALGIAGIETRSTGDALAALLGEPAPAPAPPAADRVPDRRPTPTDATRTPAPTPVGPGRDDLPVNALFDRLHEEFVRVVRDPAQLTGRADWDGGAASDGAQASTLEELGRQAASFPLLLDILRSRQPIDRVMDNFDPLDRAQAPDVVARRDVLHLFAPGIARDARAPLPGLTRREHHAMSPDSPMRVGVGVGRPDGGKAA